MRLPILALAALVVSASLCGCGGSATIPAPPSTPTVGPPPGSSPEMAKAPKNPVGAMKEAAPPTFNRGPGK